MVDFSTRLCVRGTVSICLLAGVEGGVLDRVDDADEDVCGGTIVIVGIVCGMLTKQTI